MTEQINNAQREALRALHLTIQAGTECGLFDILAVLVNPDVINAFCDAVEQAKNELEGQ